MWEKSWVKVCVKTETVSRKKYIILWINNNKKKTNVSECRI